MQQIRQDWQPPGKDKNWLSVQQYYVGMVSLSVLFLVLLNIYALRPMGIGSIALNEFGIVFIAPVMVIQNIIADIWGKKTAYKVSLFALVCQIGITILTLIALAMPVDDARADMADNFAAVFSSHWRIVMASILAFVVASFFNIFVFDKVKHWLRERLSVGIVYFLAATISTVISQILDDGTFNILAYAPIGLTSYEFDWSTLWTTMLVGAVMQILLETVIVGVFAMHFVRRIRSQMPIEQYQ
jgi:uncharacterized integral membrane protein (TIGR00697 family)